ncbi:MAG TPA: PQQ-binding-like beta-propeller repeat protein [Acidimicrobiales bacterium]|nr:PQQ-binding-like beta-propeller repeat protein [Acidimicrobiales bacterium]
MAALAVAVASLTGCAAGSVRHPSTQDVVAGPWDWPTYGHDAQHTFHGRTTLTEAKATSLEVAWYFPTGDAVTATPTVVDGTVYVGSWDDDFYALDLENGRVRWKYRLSAQNAVTPYPGQHPRPLTSDGGLVTSSAWYQPGAGRRPDLVIFGGGYTLYALNASTGALYWRHDYTGRPGQPAAPDTDGTRIFSSPVVVGDKVLFGVDVDGARGYRGYAVAADLDTGDPVWEYQTDVDEAGHVLNDGCGSVWSSGTLLPRLGLVVFSTADCHFSNPPPTAETVFALHIGNGKLAWIFRPTRPDDKCDFDFGATPNAGVTAGGTTVFLGAGSKDGTYYSIDPATGHTRWSTNVVFGGFSGGFIATAAYDGHRVYGSTGIGDFGNFEGAGEVYCDPHDPQDQPMQEPSVHAFDAATGTVAWQADHGASFSPTTVAGGMTFNGPALGGAVLDVRDAESGALVDQVGLPGASWSGTATVGDALVVGIGNSYTATPAGVAAITPGGQPPVVPRSR